MTNSGTPPSSKSGMDRKISKSGWAKKTYFSIAAVIFVAILFVYAFIIGDSGSTLSVDKERLSIAAVKSGTFQDFIQVTGNVQPIQTVYLDAVEGGVIEDIYRESGMKVSRGDTIVTLSNSDLRLTVLQRTSAIYDQINQTRNSRLNIEQNSLSLKERLAQAENQLEVSESRYKRQKPIHEKGLLSEQKFLEIEKNYEYHKKRYSLIYESFRQDSIKSKQQLAQIDQSLDRMWRSLDAVQKILDRLTVTAPIDGQLSTRQLNPGQSINSGERIGQIDILDDYKVRVAMDEYHLPNIRAGLRGTIDHAGKEYELEITKVYPVVENGEFQVDMEFADSIPDDLRRGQSLRIRLEMGSSSESLIVNRGSFYQSTGGSWVYKLTDDGDIAVKQEVRIGRQNPDYFEILSGLEEGDEIITSGYNSFGEKEKLILD